MDKIDCSKCNSKFPIKDTKNPIFSCDLCRKYLCGDCSDLNASEARCMFIQKRSLIFHCGNCSKEDPVKLGECRILQEVKKLQENFEQQICKRLSEEFRKLEDLIKLGSVTSQQEIVHVSNRLCEKKLFASAVYSKKSADNEVLFIKPREKQGSSKTKNDIREKIDPKKMAIGVENIREVKNGAILINCSDLNTKEKIKQKVNNNMNDQYSVEEGRQRDPKVIIRGVEEEFVDGEDDHVIECLREQNNLGETPLKILKKYKQPDKTNKGNIIMSVGNVVLKNQICNDGKLNIGWRRCMVHEYFSVVRCFKCARYGHVANNCNNTTTCFNCAGSHKTSDCTSSSFKCINCCEAKIKYNKSLKVEHKVTDPDCECYKRIINTEVKKTKSQ